MSSEIKVADVDQVKELFTALKDKMNSLKIIEIPELKPLNELNVTSFCKIIDAYYDGVFTLNDITNVWNVGDSINIHIDDIPASNSISATSAIDMDFVILDFNYYDLTTPIKDKNKCLLTLQMKDCFKELGLINPTGTDRGYQKTNRNTWCDNDFINALPEKLKNEIKVVRRTIPNSGNGGGWTTTSIVDSLAFIPTCSQINHDGLNTTGQPQFTYYKTSGNNIKRVNGNNADYYTSSPGNHDSGFYYISASGQSDYTTPNTPKGISVAFSV